MAREVEEEICSESGEVQGGNRRFLEGTATQDCPGVFKGQHLKHG